MAKETQQSIADWINETFGESTPIRDVVRANEEMAELVEAYDADPLDPKIPEEAADVTIVLCRLAQKVGVDFGPLIKPAIGGSLPMDRPSLANKVMSKLLRSAAANTPDVPSHLGHLVMCLQDLTGRYRINLWDAVERKMAVNRSRLWKRDGTGCGYHVKGE